jgi:hypothetical protein
MTKAFMVKPLSFEDAVRLFKQWGFQVEPGPRPEGVTLILEGPGHRTYAVYEASMLPQIASVAQHIRWRNGVVAGAYKTWGRRASCPLPGAEVLG